MASEHKDCEHGIRIQDRITSNGSSSSTPEDSPSKVATPKDRSSLESRHVVPRTESKLAHHWQRAQERLPRPVERVGRKIVAWIRGPEPLRVHLIAPFFERIQTFPIRTLGRLPRLVRICIFFAACLLWSALFGGIISDFGLPTNLAGYGAPVRLSCVNTLWPDPRSCGLDGRECLPFSNSAFAFNCPANCRSVQVLNPKSIGNQIINYRSLVVGGASNTSDENKHIYRGDSFICGAAIHAGVIGNGKGGCGVLSLIGESASYGSATRNGISSIGFDSNFPMSFEFNQTEAVSRASSKCRDPRWNLLTLSIIFTALFSIFTSSPATFFAPIFVILFFQVAMASDTPYYTDYASLASSALERFLPAAFVGVIIYQTSIRRALKNCKALLEKTILWIGGAWIGALGNYTFDRIPIQRLTGHDIRQQPGAIAALIIIVLIIFVIVLYQAWCFRAEGRLPRYLALYATLGVSLGILAAIPRLNLRIHHYILALLLLPGTALQTRVSLLCQGLLVGLFINGIARWGFDSILQTSTALRGDAQLGSGTPSILDPIINGSSIIFTWRSLLRGYEGVSVLVNDVERYRGWHGAGESNFTWTRQAVGLPEYFRFGFVNYLPFGAVSYSDFTRAGVWEVNGSWSGIPPGRT